MKHYNKECTHCGRMLRTDVQPTITLLVETSCILEDKVTYSRVLCPWCWSDYAGEHSRIIAYPLGLYSPKDPFDISL